MWKKPLEDSFSTLRTVAKIYGLHQIHGPSRAVSDRIFFALKLYPSYCILRCGCHREVRRFCEP